MEKINISTNQQMRDPVLYRDGTAQSQRLPKAIMPDYVAVEERTVKDIFTFIQNYAKELKFYDLKDTHTGDWSSFFNQDINDIIAFIKNPKVFAGNVEKETQLSQPHLVLLLTFLQLLEHQKAQINALTKKHLDFYYRQALQIVKKDAVPDQVNVVIKLDSSSGTYELKAGTLFYAGRDSKGNDLLYKSQADILINHAKISQVKTLHNAKNRISLRDYRLRNSDIMQIMELALGDPNPGNSLPPYPAGIKSLKDILDKWNHASLGASARNYCSDRLFMKKEELEYVLDKERFASDDKAWEQCYTILENAHLAKAIAKGAEILKGKKEAGDRIKRGNGFQDIAKYCWGQPGEKDPLPTYPKNADTLEDVHTQRQSTDKNVQKEADNYIRRNLYLNENDFSEIIKIKNNTASGESEWKRAYKLMEIARRKSRKIGNAKLQKEVHSNFYAASDATKTAFKRDYEDKASSPHWKTFGTNPIDKKSNTVTFANMGFAISSSVLAMEQGKRKIIWTVAFESQSYNKKDMELLFADGNSSSDAKNFPFSFAVTTQKKWVNIQADSVRHHICITRDPEKTYAANGLQHSASDNVVQKTSGAAFTATDKDGFLVWGTNGTICRINSIISDNKVTVTPLTATMPAGQRPKTGLVKKYGSEDIYFNALQFELSIADKEAPIAVLLGETAGTFKWPVLKMGLRNLLQTSSIAGFPDYYTNSYNRLKNLKLEKSCIKVSVGELNKFDLSNDDTLLKSTGPFEPFGNNPEVGATCYFAHTETVRKKLDTFHMNIEWMGAPDDFKTHYENYWKVNGLKDYPYMNNTGYTAQLKFKDKSLTLPLKRFDYTETFKVAAAGAQESFLLSGTPLTTATTTDFKVRTKDGTPLTTVSYTALLKSQYIVVNTEKRSIGDTFTVTYSDSSKETLKVSKIDSNVTFYLKQGIQNDQIKAIANNRITWASDNVSHNILSSGKYQSARIVINTQSQSAGNKIEVTYTVAGAPYLFSAPDATNISKWDIRNISEVLAESNTTYKYAGNNELHTEDDVREWDRFWEVSLDRHGFYSTDYNRLLAKQQLAGYESVKGLLLNPPYIPKIKKMTFGYTALATVAAKAYPSGKNDDLLLYVHPFGYSEIYPLEETKDTQGTSYAFFPEYKDEGYLYIGFENLKTPNNLSVLFQMAEGTANSDVPKATVVWSYLSNNRWVKLEEKSIPYDATKGLINTGIITFVLPEEATKNNITLPNGLHWLRAAVNQYTDAVCETIAIKAQAINAVLTNPDKVPSDHFIKLLPTGSITKTAKKIPEIEKIEQPYTSGKGKPEEQEINFYVRIAERIRHKKRLLTLWDYERMVLEKFPDIYKVKCLFVNNKTNTKAEPGKVEIIVVPDIKGKIPFNPFKPNVPADRLLEIKTYLGNYLPQSAAVTVRNASFIPIKIRCAIRFHKAYNAGVYKKQIDEDLKKYLSPWAYDQSAEITFGNKIYPNSIINFLETKPYVDYIAKIKILQATIGTNGTVKYNDVRRLQNGENVAFVVKPDEVLMSDRQHVIDLIATDRYDHTKFQGINYMKTELDFIIEPTKLEGINYMKVGLNFTVGANP